MLIPSPATHDPGDSVVPRSLLLPWPMSQQTGTSASCQSRSRGAS